MIRSGMPGRYHISWFPTRMEADTVLPLDTVWTSTGTGNLLLDLSTEPFGDTIPFFADTLRSDYAFVISLGIFPKSLMLTQTAEGSETNSGLDFTMYPNPAHDVVYLRFFDDAPKDNRVVDVMGRRILEQTSITRTVIQLPLDALAKGVYWVHVIDHMHWKVKKIAIQ
ncbi:MAG: hypothetical protein GFGODING_00377 [Flavobacteriales bacterium]|nr:hypothetical protein [Flavobacteriales bacterium]